MSVSPGSESLSRSHWQYCMRVLLYFGFFCFGFFFLLSSPERRRRLLPSYTDPIDNPRLLHTTDQKASAIPVPTRGGSKVYRSAKTRLLGRLRIRMLSVHRRQSFLTVTRPQLCHPSCCKPRADLKGCSSLFTQNTFLWLPVACLLHLVSFYLNERQKNYYDTLIRVFSTILPDGTCTRSQSTLPSVLFLTVLGTGWQ